MGMDLRVVPAEEWFERGIDSSHEGEHDLGLMVTDFLETGGCGSGSAAAAAADSWCSSDSDSGFPDPSSLSDKIQFLKYSMPQHENEVLSAVRALMLTIKEKDLHSVKSGTCNASCIRFYLAKLLRLSGYDAAVCSTRWQSGGKVPGGDNEYIDIILSDTDIGQDERLIIDIDFRSQFEIARAVDSYQRILESLPVVFVGTLARLNKYLQVMVDAAKFSLKQNSMPLPPWRSLNYLRSKWHSPHKRHLGPINQEGAGMFSPGMHRQCAENLKRLQFALQAEQGSERFMKKNTNCSRRIKPERMRNHGAYDH